nr:hypothetical protein [Tanacetum cinerariifolium]
MERGFFIQKGCRGRRGVMKKSLNRNTLNSFLGIGVSTESDDTMNQDTLAVVASTIKEGVTPFVVDTVVENEKINSLDDNAVLESLPTLTTPVTTTAGNALGKSSYANITGKPSGKKVNVRTLFTPEGNGIDVVVLVDSIHAISERFTNTSYGFFLRKKVAYPVVSNYVRNTWGKYRLIRSMFSSSTKLFSFQFSSMDGLDAMFQNGPWFIRNNPLILKKWHPNENLLKEDASYARVMVKLQADVELKENIVVAMPKITREGYFTCNVRVEYEWKPLRCLSCKVFRHIHEECMKNTGFKPQKEYQPVTKKPNPSSSGNKKNGVEPTIEGTTNLVNNEATLSGSSFMHIDNDREFASNTPIDEKINKIERQIGEGKLKLLDSDRNSLVPTSSVESDSNVEVVFDDIANLMISTSGKDGIDK